MGGGSMTTHTFEEVTRMKVLCLQGSPRKNGNTNKILGWVEEALTEAGHEIEHIYVADKHIGGCISCYQCQQDPDELVCSVQDDGNAILASIAAADAVIYATPLYCWDFSGQMKPLIDRHISLVTGFMDPATHKSHVEGTRAGLLVTCGGPAGEGNTDCISTIFRRMADFGKCQVAAELIVPHCMSPDDLGDDQKKIAQEFAEELSG